MNKQFEAGLLVAIAVLVSMSATTMFHINNKLNTNPVDQYVAHEWQALNHWVKNHGVRANSESTPVSEYGKSPVSGYAQPSGNTQAKGHTSQQSQPSVPIVPAISMNPGQFGSGNGDTYGKLVQIGAEFVDSMTPSDWQALSHALTNDNAQQASDVVAGFMQSHISSDDRVWLAEHFQGSQSFNEEDVSLLQNSIQQVASELTPQEMSLLEQALPFTQSK